MTTGPDDTLRLIWPQWQGAGAENAADLVPEVPADEARRGYAVGSSVLEAVLPAAQGPTVTVPVDLSDAGTQTRDGVEAKDAVLTQLRSALSLIAEHDPARIMTVGGECSTSVAPFAALAQRYDDDLAIVWIDSHPDTDTPETGYDGHHAMAVSSLTGHGDPDVLAALPATVPAERVAIAGIHDWVDDAYAHVAEWGVTTFAPGDLRADSASLLDWLAGTGCSKVAIHLDVDVVDSDEVTFGLGAVPGGLSRQEVRRLVAELQGAADVVGFTVAEYVPRQVMQVQAFLRDLPLI